MVTVSGRRVRCLPPAALLVGLLVVSSTALLAACSTGAIDTSCDVSDARAEIDHIVSESGLKVASVDLVRCADSWTYVVATIAGPGSEPSSDRFLFRADAGMLVLLAPETVCETQTGDLGGPLVVPEPMRVVPDSMRVDVCGS